MKAFALLLAAQLAPAALSVKVLPAVNQAAVHITGYSGSCTLTLRRTNASGDIHADVNASVDTSRADTIDRADGTRIVTLGHAPYMLATDADWHLTITGCGTISPVTFRTFAPAANTMPVSPKYDCTSGTCLAQYPPVDMSASGRGKWYTDPLTGVELKLMKQPLDFMASNSQSGETGQQFHYWAGGSGWTNPANAANGGTGSTAVASTNWLYLYPQLIMPYNEQISSFENLGLIVYGNTSGTTTDADKTLEYCIGWVPGTCVSSVKEVVVTPTGAVIKVPNGSTHPNGNGSFPVEYPNPGFAGWGTGFTVPRDRLPHKDFLVTLFPEISSVSSGVVTITSPTAVNHFQPTLQAGNHIYIEGSGCTGEGMTDMCVIASVQHAGQVTLTNTSVNVASTASFESFPMVLMVRKKNSTGTMNVGLRYSQAGGTLVSTNANGLPCSRVSKTRSDGVRGSLCAVGVGAGFGVYFISDDGEHVHPLGIPKLARSLMTSLGVGEGQLQSISFSSTEPNVLYGSPLGLPNTLIRATYTGDYGVTTPKWEQDEARGIIQLGGSYNYSTGWGSTTLCPAGDTCEDFQQEIALSDTLDNQIDANPSWTQWNSSPWSAWSSPSLAGITGDLAIFYKTIGSQDNGPCHIAVVNLLSGNVIDVFSTLDPASDLGWGYQCHTVQANATIPNMLSFNNHSYDGRDATKPQAGPWTAPVVAVKKSGSWNTDTSLTRLNVTANYDTACPAVAERFSAFGATGSQCVELKIKQACNEYPHAIDFSLAIANGWGDAEGKCSWNASYAAGPPIRAGNKFADPLAVFGTDLPHGSADTEHFRVVTEPESLGGGEYRVYAQRNANRDRNCWSSNGGANLTPAGNNCSLVATTQTTHADDWSARMIGGSRGGGRASDIDVWYPAGTLASKVIVDLPNSFGGHTTTGTRPNSAGYYHLGGGEAKYISSIAAMGEYPVPAATPVRGPKFQGVANTIGGGNVQAYPDASQQDAATQDRLTFGLDWNHVNNNNGTAPQQLANTLATTRSITNISGDVWRVGATGGTISNQVYRTQGFNGWAGRFGLKDISAPGSDIAAGPYNTLCYAYAAGECVGGSSAGQIFVKVKYVYSSATSCSPGLYWANVPCAWINTPGAGFIRQYRTNYADADGASNRLLTSLLKAPGTHYSYTGVTTNTAGTLAISKPSGWVEAGRDSPWIIKLPKFVDRGTKPQYGGLTVNVPALSGVTHARVKFGYDTNLYCTTRGESCVTDTVLQPGFGYAASDTLTPQTCASGCAISVPLMPGRLAYYQLEVSSDGTTWTARGGIKDAVVK
jgi:hypothetical protein